MSVEVKSGTSNIGDNAPGATEVVEGAKQALAVAGQPEAVEGEINESAWDDKTKAYISKLRGEAASHRTKAKDLASKLTATEEQKKAILKAAGIELEAEKPEDIIQGLTAETHTLIFRNAILQTAMKQGIPDKDVDYFEYLVQKAASELEDGAELTDEIMSGIASTVKKVGGGGAKANTSVGQGAPNPGESGAITLDMFCKMNTTQKSKLYVDNQALYESLRDQAKRSNRLI